MFTYFNDLYLLWMTNTLLPALFDYFSLVSFSLVHTHAAIFYLLGVGKVQGNGASMISTIFNAWHWHLTAQMVILK